MLFVKTAANNSRNNGTDTGAQCLTTHGNYSGIKTQKTRDSINLRLESSTHVSLNSEAACMYIQDHLRRSLRSTTQSDRRVGVAFAKIWRCGWSYTKNVTC